MKHVKKRYVGEIKVDFDLKKLSDEHGPDKDEIKEFLNKEIDNIESGVAQIDNVIHQCFFIKLNNKAFLIPEPDPSIVYFSTAQNIYSKLLDSIDQLHWTKDRNNIIEIREIFYLFFQLGSVYITNLYTAIEAFNNSLIPEDWKYLDEDGVEHDKYSIQRNIKYETKIKKVIPDICKKSFAISHGHKYALIKKMISLRDSVVHTKYIKGTFPQTYRPIYVNFLNYNFKDLIYFVKDYINFYEPNRIEPCDCGKDY